MNYLIEFGFDENELKSFEKNNNNFLVEKVIEFKELIKTNIIYLKNLGVNNYKEIFSRHAEMFLMDNSLFMEIFQKYDQKDLIEKLKNNPDLVEQL